MNITPEQVIALLDALDAAEEGQPVIMHNTMMTDKEHIYSLRDREMQALQAENAELRGLVKECAEAMRAWGNEEDGIPDAPLGILKANPWEAYFGCCAALNWAFEGRVPERYREALKGDSDNG